jgi:4-amino-4-deoxy-L-arabinose transferase-like glycosyltransferase
VTRPGRPRPPEWLALGLLLLLALWWRGHTFGPDVKAAIGWAPWPVVRGETEPLDCDEAAYAYMGRRVVAGDVLYRDLTENKPPGGYALYALAVWLGGATELAIRLLPVPLVLLNVALVWGIGRRLAGATAGTVAALGFIVLSTDPYLYGNGAQLEAPLNLFATAALAATLRAEDTPSSRAALAWAVAAGVGIGLAALVKQVALLHAAVFVVALWLPRRPDGRARTLALAGGVILPWLVAAAVLAAQGGLGAAVDDVFRYGGALASDTPPDPKAPPMLVRWITGNADPDGQLPPPFGRTDYLVWWGTGSWPMWVAGAGGVLWLLRGPGRARRLAAAWTLAAWVQVAAPRLFWAHYYLLATPGLALAVGVLAADALRGTRSGRGGRRAGWMVLGVATAAALLGTLALQVRDYLLVPPVELTVRHKGGRQWVELRRFGREIGRRTRAWPDGPAHLHVWGWQSPLYFYSGLDTVTPQFFADPLARAFRDRPHPQVTPRLARMVRDLEAHPPDLISCGEVPPPALRRLLERRYVPSRLSMTLPDGRGFWVRQDRYAAFEGPPRPGPGGP